MWQQMPGGLCYYDINYSFWMALLGNPYIFKDTPGGKTSLTFHRLTVVSSWSDLLVIAVWVEQILHQFLYRHLRTVLQAPYWGGQNPEQNKKTDLIAKIWSKACMKESWKVCPKYISYFFKSFIKRVEGHLNICTVWRALRAIFTASRKYDVTASSLPDFRQTEEIWGQYFISNCLLISKKSCFNIRLHGESWFAFILPSTFA